MPVLRVYGLQVGIIFLLLQVETSLGSNYVTISQDGPAVLGAAITLRADLFDMSGNRPSGKFQYSWTDHGFHSYTSEWTSNTTTYWTLVYPAKNSTIGIHHVEVTVRSSFVITYEIAKGMSDVRITSMLNGKIMISQPNRTTESRYVSSTSEAKSIVSLHKGDYNYLMTNATSISTFWFVDCKFYGQSENFSFGYNFTIPNTSHTIEALVIASFDPPPLTTVAPVTTSTTTIPTSSSMAPPVPINSTKLNTTSTPNETTPATRTTSTTVKPMSSSTPMTNSIPEMGNLSFPYVCLNSSIIPPDPNKTYGYFVRKVDVRAPISNITVEGTNWVQPWALLSLNVSCGGTGPFSKCLQYHQGVYNVTGNETCSFMDKLQSCNFSITHYFLEPSVYTILVILNNDIGKQIYPLTINIYKVTTKPQLSVIVVPVTCSLVAMVLIIFGVAYYIQSRARFTIEVADFDFGHSNPEMEYKTFTERLRDSFNNAKYKPLNAPGSMQ
ncbi:uncharacterized protein LOC105694949 isoform X2 [Orussus abietinus]|uniref:uncharacterized protein LOC105694949 isoform X2 n=1 Tax=Orussus abietinus TaxID=222816 RepID=UPI0006257EC6|nr:uncharacterized protein LOC105694949 isoform X2 [Orussus abietinus]